MALAQGLLAVLVAATTSFAAAPPASAQVPETPEVTVTDLAPLPGATGEGTRWVLDINDQGQVVGSSGREPVLWEEGRPVPLWIAPDSGMEASHINDRGDIILGNLVVDMRLHAYHGRDGQVTALNPGGDYGIEVIDLNESGQVLLRRTPTFEDAVNGVTVTELWQNGTATDLRLPAPPQGLRTALVGLSDGGHVLFGYGQTAAFGDVGIWRGTGGVLMWQNGMVTRLTSSEVRAVDVNRSGQVVGIAGNPTPFIGGFTDGVLLSGGRSTPLGLFPVGINDRGQVAGYRTLNGETHAVLWENGRVTDLGTLGGGYSRAVTLNERGQVLGVSRAPDQTMHAFLWTGGRRVDLGRTPDPYGGEIAFALNDEGQAVGPAWMQPVAPPITTNAKPVMWTVHGGGGPDPTDPPAPQCFTSPNSAHVQAGRATSWLIFTWAAGSGTYIGLTSQTTSLREATPGQWEPVPGC